MAAAVRGALSGARDALASLQRAAGAGAPEQLAGDAQLMAQESAALLEALDSKVRAVHTRVARAQRRAAQQGAEAPPSAQQPPSVHALSKCSRCLFAQGLNTAAKT